MKKSIKEIWAGLFKGYAAKQIITIVAVALVAVLLFVSYMAFFRDDGIKEGVNSFYTLNEVVKENLDSVDDKVQITLHGYVATDDSWETLRLFCVEIANANKKISVKTDSADGDFIGVRISAKNGTESIPFDSVFKKLYDGTPYAFDGEALVANGIFKLVGLDAVDVPLRALSGYDTDGDTVATTGAVYMFPVIDRTQISNLTVTNEHGSYHIYQDNGGFYFTESRVLAYNDEMFSMISTNCRSASTYGKMEIPEGQTWASYGLDKEENATASYRIVTVEDSEGYYDLHAVYIGKLSSSGNYYFARYIGGRFKDVGKDGDLIDDEKVVDFSKEKIYLFPVSSAANIMLPKTDMLSPTIVNAVTDTNDLYNIEDIHIEYYDQNIHALAQKISVFSAASNLAAVDQSSLTKVISDKQHASSNYKNYSGGWKSNINVFGGFTSKDGDATYIEGALALTAKNGEYVVKFGLLRDDANGAGLPKKISVNISYDGINWQSVEGGSVAPDQADGTVKNYEIAFKTEKSVKFFRLIFDVPQIARTYVVFDEIRIFADGVDAQPVAAISGSWKLVTPSEYIPEGYNYAYLDMANFNDFVQSITSIEGERVVDCAFSKDGDASPGQLNKEKLAKYGLDNPARHYSYTHKGVVCDLYVSAPNEEGKYYAYSVFSGEVDGKEVIMTTDVIVELSTTTAKWLNWEFVEYLDHALFSVYINDMTAMDVTVDGTTHRFDLKHDDNKELIKVTYNGNEQDVKSFKYLYQSMLSIYMQDEYKPQEGEKATEILRIKIHSETNSPEVVFYQISATRCYFTVDGQGSYYAMVSDVTTVRDNLAKYIAGEEVR